jgi:hypothetical protein
MREQNCQPAVALGNNLFTQFLPLGLKQAIARELGTIPQPSAV